MSISYDTDGKGFAARTSDALVWLVGCVTIVMAHGPVLSPLITVTPLLCSREGCFQGQHPETHQSSLGQTSTDTLDQVGCIQCAYQLLEVEFIELNIYRVAQYSKKIYNCFQIPMKDTVAYIETRRAILLASFVSGTVANLLVIYQNYRIFQQFRIIVYNKNMFLKPPKKHHLWSILSL